MQLKLQRNTKITLSILFISLGIILLTYNYFGSIKSDVYNEKNIQLLTDQIVLNEEVETINEEIEEATEVTSTTTLQTNDYIGYLTIPDINVKRGFTSLDSPYNKLSYNIILVQGSTMPDVENGNLILAGHNGHSKVSFFNDLYKLELGAHAYVTYNNKTYDYVMVNSYDVPKTGTVSITRNPEKTTLTLITCHQTDNKKQVVYIFELQNVK